MNGDLPVMLVVGIVTVLVAFEVVVALVNLIGSVAAPTRATRFGRIPASIASTIWLARPRMVREHVADHRRYLTGSRSRCEPLRSERYGRQLRATIRHRCVSQVRFERSHSQP
jgi:hypothetical protein